MCDLGTKPSHIAVPAAGTTFSHPDPDDIMNIGCHGNSEEEKENCGGEEVHTASSAYVPGSLLMALWGVCEIVV